MTNRIRWTGSRDSPGDPAFTGHAGGLYALFKIWPPEDPGDEWLLTAALPGKEGERLYGFPVDLKLEAERWLEEFVSSLGAIFPEYEISDDEDREPVEVRFAAGRRVRYAHPDAGYPGEAEDAAKALTLGEVYVIAWADIGQSRTNLNLYRDGKPAGRFNSVFFEPADDQETAVEAAREKD